MLKQPSWRSKPKIDEAVQDAIYNGANAPIEVLKFQYRKIFGLSAAELEEEPADQFFTNLRIYSYIKDKQRLEQNNVNKS